MNTTPQIDSNARIDTNSTRRRVAGRTAASAFEHQQPQQVITPNRSMVPAKKVVPQLTTFRALGRQVFGAEAGREYVFEAILFVWMMAVAAWPLGVTLNQLGTMMISPPNALW